MKLKIFMLGLIAVLQVFGSFKITKKDQEYIHKIRQTLILKKTLPKSSGSNTLYSKFNVYSLEKVLTKQDLTYLAPPYYGEPYNDCGTLLHYCAIVGDFNSYKYFESRGLDSTINYRGTSVFDCALVGGNLKLIKYLVKNGASLKLQSKSMYLRNYTPVDIAVRYNHFPILEYLKSQKVSFVSFSDKQKNGKRDLIVSGNLKMIKFMEQQININYTEDDLDHCSELGHLEVFKHIYSKKIHDLNWYPKYPLKSGKLKWTKYFVQNFDLSDKKTWHYLSNNTSGEALESFHYLRNNFPTMMKKIIQYSQKNLYASWLSFDDLKPMLNEKFTIQNLFSQRSLPKLDTIKYLKVLEQNHNGSIPKKIITPLIKSAVSNNNIKAMNFFRTRTDFSQIEGIYSSAAYSANIETIKFLDSVHTRFTKGVLLSAINSKHRDKNLEVVKYLLKTKPKLLPPKSDIVNKAYHRAYLDEKFEVADYLLKYGVDLESESDLLFSGMTPLDLAIYKLDFDYVKKLLDLGANPFLQKRVKRLKGPNGIIDKIIYNYKGYGDEKINVLKHLKRNIEINSHPTSNGVLRYDYYNKYTLSKAQKIYNYLKNHMYPWKKYSPVFILLFLTVISTCVILIKMNKKSKTVKVPLSL
ncbi:MAG: ankyrin repeat domain-containing protein [Lentisphaeraceae bacterium]|nr:ankyrin repeat domain-containing protein [Lentisphaeraceae bacterium]